MTQIVQFGGSVCAPYTVWKLASVAKGIKSKTFAKHASILDNKVPIERYDT